MHTLVYCIRVLWFAILSMSLKSDCVYNIDDNSECIGFVLTYVFVHFYFKCT